VFPSDFKQKLNATARLSQGFKIKFHSNPFTGFLSSSCGHTDRQGEPNSYEHSSNLSLRTHQKNLISTVRTENLEGNVILNVQISGRKIMQAT